MSMYPLQVQTTWPASSDLSYNSRRPDEYTHSTIRSTNGYYNSLQSGTLSSQSGYCTQRDYGYPSNHDPTSQSSYSSSAQLNHPDCLRPGAGAFHPPPATSRRNDMCDNLFSSTVRPVASTRSDIESQTQGSTRQSAFFLRVGPNEYATGPVNEAGAHMSSRYNLSTFASALRPLYAGNTAQTSVDERDDEQRIESHDPYASHASIGTNTYTASTANTARTNYTDWRHTAGATFQSPSLEILAPDPTHVGRQNDHLAYSRYASQSEVEEANRAKWSGIISKFEEIAEDYASHGYSD